VSRWTTCGASCRYFMCLSPIAHLGIHSRQTTYNGLVFEQKGWVGIGM
jgi:hypothetical protein